MICPQGQVGRARGFGNERMLGAVLRPAVHARSGPASVRPCTGELAAARRVDAGRWPGLRHPGPMIERSRKLWIGLSWCVAVAGCNGGSAETEAGTGTSTGTGTGGGITLTTGGAGDSEPTAGSDGITTGGMRLDLGEGSAATTETCADADVKFEAQTPTVLLLIDQSGSMTENFGGTDRWDAVYDALFRQYGRDIALVVHAAAARLDVATGAVRTDLGQLRCGQLLARYPVQVAVVGAAGGQRTAATLGHQGCVGAGLRLGDSCRRGIFAAGRAAHDRGTVHRACRQLGRSGLGRAGPASGRRDLAVELLGCKGETAQWLQCQKAGADQEREFFTKRGVFDCHLVFSPGFLRAIGLRPHASRWAEKDAG